MSDKSMMWTKPGLERRGELNGSTHPMRRGELQPLTYSMLIAGYELNWETGCLVPATMEDTTAK